MFANKKGITLLELLIAMVILGTGLASIITMMNTGIKFVDRSRQEILAINLAREGVEGIYQIRNTNRLRRGGDRDLCRLKVDPLVDTSNDGCGNDTRMGSSNYIIDTASTADGQEYFVLSGGAPAQDLDLRPFVAGITDRYSLCFDENIGRKACPGQMQTNSEGYFFRQVKGIGLYDKTQNIAGGSPISSLCPNGNGNISCRDGRALEYRFCVRVGYLKVMDGVVELCGLITNFDG